MVKLGCCLPGGSFMPEGVAEVPQSIVEQITDNCYHILDAGFDYTEVGASMLYSLTDEELAELLVFVRGLIRCDVLGEPVGEVSLCGYTADRLREVSHHPDIYLGQGHFVPSAEDLPALIYVNRLRTLIRQAELACYKAFRKYDGTVARPDMVQAMNRLSSLCWIWECRLKAREQGVEGP